MSPSAKDRKTPSDAKIRGYFQVLKKDPRSRVFAPLADALVGRGRLEEAERLCRMGLESNPDFSDGHLAHARVLYHRFRYREALEEVKIALGLDSRNCDAYLIAGEIFLARSEHKAASDACARVLDGDPQNAKALKLLERIRGAQSSASTGASATGSAVKHFKASSDTSPGRRATETGEPPGMSDPFQQLMQEARNEASALVEDDGQPLRSPRSGESGGRVESEEESFEIPTAPSSRRRAITPPPEIQVPSRDRLTSSPPKNRPGLVTGSSPNAPHQEEAESVDAGKRAKARAALAPGLSHAASETAQRADAAAATSLPANPVRAHPRGGLDRIEAIQAIIDRYSDRQATQTNQDASALRVPRLWTMLLALGVMLLLVGLVALILLLMPAQMKALPHAADERSALSSSPKIVSRPRGEVAPTARSPEAAPVEAMANNAGVPETETDGTAAKAAPEKESPSRAQADAKRPPKVKKKGPAKRKRPRHKRRPRRKRRRW